MEERFGGLTVPKKGRACTQHRVPTDHLADMDGLNIRHRQPRSWYTGMEDKFIAEYQRDMEEQFSVLEDQIKALATQIFNLCGHNGIGSRNPFTECWTQGCQHLAQAHANRRVSRFKVDTPKFQGCLQPKEFMVTKKNRKFSQKVPRKMAEKLPREALEIMSQSVVKEEDGFIVKYCSVDWISPPIYDIYPDEEKSLEKVNLLDMHHVLDKSPEDKAFDLRVAPINYVDFIGVVAILSNSSNQIGDEICMAGERQEEHDNVDKLDFWQIDVRGNQDYHQHLPMIRDIKCILGCCLVVILRNGEWNEFTGHLKDCGKDSSNSGRILSNLGRMI